MAKGARPAKEGGDVNAQKPYKGMHQDNSYAETPGDSYRVLWNGVDGTEEGDDNFVSNERSNENITSLPEGFKAIGNKYIGDGEVAVWATNSEGRDIIGLLDKDDVFRSHVDTTVLGLRITNQVDATYRLRRGREKVVYWVDSLHNIRVYNFAKPEDFFNFDFRQYLEGGGNYNTYSGEKWDRSSFELNKTYSKIPAFVTAEILEFGAILPGSYSFAFQYIDEDLNPTAWITTSNPVNIFNDSLDKPYHRIRGSKNTNTDAQNFGPASKSIKITLANLDENFPFYRIAVIQANALNGKPNRALLSSNISTSSPTYTYSGNDEALAETPLQDIILPPLTIRAPKHIDQLESRLIVANGRGSNYNWCGFQQYASKIASDLTTTEVILNSVESAPNIKNALSTFQFRGNMPGEVYSYGIVYVFPDEVSPAFHIPGKHVSNTTSLMEYFESTETYNADHNCLDGQDYWGKDATGHGLKNKQVRHHKFPTRLAVSKPLIDSTDTATSINKYKLTFRVELISPTVTWPVDTDGNPITINYVATYKPTFASSPFTINSYLTEDSVGQDIVVYDDVNPLSVVSGSDYLVFDANCELILTYTTEISHVPTYDTYVDTTIQNATISEIFGIEFSNIEKPHPDCIGFYIVRHERLDTDRSVIDNAIFGMNLKKDNYRAFSLIYPKVEESKRDDSSAWFWSPEHQFYRKQLEFTGIDIQGFYDEAYKYLPTPTGGDRKMRMLVVEDVYAGTSYIAEVHKKNDKDDDGFSLAVSYRNYLLAYSENTGSTVTLPAIDKILYLDACANKIHNDLAYFNTSCDNKIGIVTFDPALDTDIFSAAAPTTGRILYGTLTKNTTSAYSDYLTRSYYKEHNNPFLFEEATVINSAEVFNGDAYISPHNFVTTMFFEQRMADRGKKDKTWQIVAGAILIVAGVVASIFTLGASLSIAAAGTAVLLAGLAITYGVSLAMSGIKFEQMKSMIDNDYPKGLQDLIKDQDTMYTTTGVFDYPGPLPPYVDDGTNTVGDDAFIWHSDRASNVWVESSIPYAIRAPLTASVTDFVDAPNPNYDEEEFKAYLTDKLTILDKDQGSGRLYKGYPAAEFYDINLDYMRLNKERLFYHLALEYDCCAPEPEVFPTRVWYTVQSFQEERIDSYRVFLPNNYRDIEGELGEITDLYKVDNQLFIQTTEGLWNLPANLQERVTDQLISFIGTGDFFSIPPRRVEEDNLTVGGTKHKWATVKTREGVISVSESDGKVNIHQGDSIKAISDEGLNAWFKEHLRGYLTSQLKSVLGVDYLLDNNPANPNGIGIHSTFDGEMNRVLITKRDYVVTQSRLSTLTAIDYTPVTDVIEDIPEIAYSPLFAYSTESGMFYLAVDVFITGLEVYRRTIHVVPFSDQIVFEDRSWTISFSMAKGVWRAFHSYIPLHYINKPRTFYALIDNIIWRHNQDGHYQNFFGVRYPHILEYVATESPLVTKVWNDISFLTIAKRYSSAEVGFYEENQITFNKMIAFNNRQATLEWELIPKDTENDENYMFNQVHNLRPGEILLSRNERRWNLNDLRDYRFVYNKPVFDSSWNGVRFLYPIDKVLNTATLNALKDWTGLESLRDQYLAIRLTFDNFDDVSLTTNYVLDTGQQSFK